MFLKLFSLERTKAASRQCITKQLNPVISCLFIALCFAGDALPARYETVMAYAKKAEEVLSHIVTLGNAESSVTVTDFELGK